MKIEKISNGSALISDRNSFILGNIPTYFARINEQLEFVRETQPVLHHVVDTHV